MVGLFHPSAGLAFFGTEFPENNARFAARCCDGSFLSSSLNWNALWITCGAVLPSGCTCSPAGPNNAGASQLTECSSSVSQLRANDHISILLTDRRPTGALHQRCSGTILISG